MKINVLTVQSEAVAGDIQKNINKISDLLKASGEVSSDLIVMPELWTVGWDCPNFNKYSTRIENSDIYIFLSDLAKKYNANVIGGSSIIRKNGEKDRNTSLIFDRNGNLIATYDKYHLFSHRGQSEGKYLEPGENALIINTDIGRIGMSVCYDIRFPEVFRKYAYAGVDLIVNIAAWPKNFYDEYLSLAKARAIENQAYFISSCLTGKINDDFDFSGHSCVIDYRGRILKSVEYEETAFNVSFDTDEMKEYRQQMPFLSDCKSEYKLKEV